MELSQDRHIRAPRNLSQAVARELLLQVREGRLRPGDRVPTERELMATFEVGRNTIREAIQTLVARGVLDVRPGRGAVVLPASSYAVVEAITMSALLSQQTVKDLFEFRVLLEGEGAALAAQRASDSDLAEIETARAAHQVAVEHSLQLHELDLAFHRAVADASHNIIYRRVLDALTDLLTQARSITDRLAGEESQAEHKQIADAINARDTSSAREAMRRHFQASLKRVEEAQARMILADDD
jgi:DNA-binding FadR family transcriptional regulator